MELVQKNWKSFLLGVGFVSLIVAYDRYCDSCWHPGRLNPNHDHKGGMLPIFEPRHNLRETCKQFVLLEEHLRNKRKFCKDCIRKHLLTIEGLVDEALGLDKTGQMNSLLTDTSNEVRTISRLFVEGSDPAALSQRVRKLRKILVPICFDSILM